MKTKLCIKCQKDLPLDEQHFYRNYGFADNFESSCRDCRREQIKRQKERRRRLDITQAPYLKPSSDRKPERVGKIRI